MATTSASSSHRASRRRFNVVNGVWPLVSLRSFELITDPKVDRWPVRTVGALMLGDGLTMLASGALRDGLRSARLLGGATAVSLAATDLVCAPRGRISNVDLVDAAVKIGWVLAWASASAPDVRKSPALRLTAWPCRSPRRSPGPVLHRGRVAGTRP